MHSLYKISFKRQMRHLWVLLGYLVFAFAFVLIAAYKFGSEDLMLYFKIAGVFYLLALLPTLIIHVPYAYHNKGDRLEVNQTDGRVKYFRRGEEYLFSFDDIERVEQYLTPALKGNRVGWVPWDSYYYFKVFTKDGKRHIFTCLLLDEFNIPLVNGQFEMITTFYPLITG